MHNGTATVEDSLIVSYKINVLLPYNPAITLLDIYPRELNLYVHTETCTWICIAALFIITKTWKQPGYPSVGERINSGRSR